MQPSDDLGDRPDGAQPPQSLLPVGDGPGPSSKSASLFDPDVIVELHLDVADSAWQALMAGRATGQKDFVPCAFEFDGEVAASAAVRLKSSPADWEGNKPQFVISFNEDNNDGRFRGLRRLTLEANPGDETLIRNNLSLRLMARAGVATPRSNHARLILNGEYYGLYEQIEAVDKEFLEGRFADSEGNLYKEGVELKTNEDIGNTSDLAALDDVLYAEELAEGEGLSAAYRASLAALLDMDRVILEAAAESVLPSGDNFWSGGHNYYLYHPPGALWTIIPWDLDDVFGPVIAPTDADVLSFNGDPTIGNEPHPAMVAITRDPVWRASFLAQVGRLEATIYRTELPTLVTSLCERVRPAVEADPNKAFAMEDFDADCVAIRKAVEARSKSIRAQLSALGVGSL